MSFGICTQCFADKPVVGEYYYRTIQIDLIIHLNTGINMLIFGSSFCICKVFKCVTTKDDEAKACVLSVQSCLVKSSSKRFSPYPQRIDFNVQTLAQAIAVVWIKLSNSIMSYTDLHEKSVELAGSQGLLKYLTLDFLPKVMADDPPESSARGKMLQKCVECIYNMARAPANHVFCEEYGVVNTLLKLRNTSSGRTNMVALCGLAYLIKEKNNHLIISGKAPIDFLMNYLSSAMKQKERRWNGYTVSELADCLAQIAVNDSNKKLIAERGGITLLTKILKEGVDDTERMSACNALWMLSFDDENKEAIKNVPGTLEMLASFQASDSSKLKQLAAGVIWELQGKFLKKEKTTASKSSLRGDEADNSSNGHIMISYQWDVQRTMIQVRDHLKQHGFQVWMDIDKIGGSTLQAMASAVEESSVVLMCVSRKYKRSPNCRSEAEYAFQLQKNIIPLMMENDYQPDGWLGFIVGAKFWIDFKDRRKIQDGIERLLKEIKKTEKPEEEKMVKAVDVPDGAPPQTPDSAAGKVTDWTSVEVKNWLKDNGLLGSLKKEIANELTGKHLILLQKLRDESPDVFHNSIRADFGFKNILVQLNFVDALQNLNGGP